jgi:hypothetical protein
MKKGHGPFFVKNRLGKRGREDEGSSTTVPTKKGGDGKEAAKKRRRRKTLSDDPARPLPGDGLVCVCDPGLRTLSLTIVDAAKNQFQRFSSFDIANNAVVNRHTPKRAAAKHGGDAKTTWAAMKGDMGRGFWDEVIARLYRFLDDEFPELSSPPDHRSQSLYATSTSTTSSGGPVVRELVMENQIGHDELVVATIVSCYFKSRQPDCKWVTLPRNSVGAFFKIDAGSRGETSSDNPHSRNKSQATMFVVRNIDRFSFSDGVVRELSLRTNHFCDCVVNYAWAYLRHNTELEKGPFAYTSLMREKKTALLGQGATTAWPAAKRKEHAICVESGDDDSSDEEGWRDAHVIVLEMK